MGRIVVLAVVVALVGFGAGRSTANPSKQYDATKASEIQLAFAYAKGAGATVGPFFHDHRVVFFVKKQMRCAYVVGGVVASTRCSGG